MKTFTGVVTSTKMQKTIAVEVTIRSLHPKYLKTVKHNKTFLVHDEKGTAKEGDEVVFSECRPISKRKRFKLVKVVSDQQSAAKKGK